MAVDTSTPRTRRNLLAAGLGGLAATVVAAIGRTEATRAATGEPLIQGTANQASSQTSLNNSADGQIALHVQGDSTGLVAQANQNADATGVVGQSAYGTGVAGITRDGAGVWGEGYWGVYGTGAAGVVGDVDAGSGVMGWTGVRAAPTPPVGVGVFAGAEPGRTALFVSGQARFTRSGRASIAANRSWLTLTVPGGITKYSFALATLQTNRVGVYVQAVVPNIATGQITIYLNKVASTTSTTAVGWMVIS